jgi:SAM-dependent methyltransferase
MDHRKRIVRDGYDAVVQKFAQARHVGSREKNWVERFCGGLPRGARVLDLGCGNGEPNTAGMIAHGFQVTGVDFSHEQVIRARARCPAATIIESDLAEVELPRATFDGVLAYDSIFHLPRGEHAAVFSRIRQWLVDGGLALITFGFVPEGVAGDLHTEHLGAPTFYDAWPLGVTLEALRVAGLATLAQDVQPNPVESGVEGGHVIVLARASHMVDSDFIGHQP